MWYVYGDWHKILASYLGNNYVNTQARIQAIVEFNDEIEKRFGEWLFRGAIFLIGVNNKATLVVDSHLHGEEAYWKEHDKIKYGE